MRIGNNIFNRLLRPRVQLSGLLSAIALLGIASGCSHDSMDLLNPYRETVDEKLGVRSNQPLLDGGSSSNSVKREDRARHALEVMNSYRRAQEPQPYYPVLQPAEVRLMWVPDHLNKNGDLVPSHYYYLRVLPERWAVQDAFELDEQLDVDSKSNGGNTPWVYGKQK